MMLLPYEYRSRGDIVARDHKRSWSRKNEIAAPEPKPSLLEKMVQFDRTRRKSLGERRKEMLCADT
jgi:hypothetical protein